MTDFVLFANVPACHVSMRYLPPAELEASIDSAPRSAPSPALNSGAKKSANPTAAPRQSPSLSLPVNGRDAAGIVATGEKLPQLRLSPCSRRCRPFADRLEN